MIILGDSLIELDKLPADSIHSCVCDPPYELKFMNKKWDNSGIAFSTEIWEKVWRVLRPGAALLAFGHTRTYHRMVVAIESASFEIRDTISWLYGSGFPKSHSVPLGIDKLYGNKNRGQAIASGNKFHPTTGKARKPGELLPAYTSITEEAEQWKGWGSALKPAQELICLARKPLSESTIAQNVLKHDCGGINIDACRIETDNNLNGGAYNIKGNSKKDLSKATSYAIGSKKEKFIQPIGRWPANIILECCCVELKDNPKKPGKKVHNSEIKRKGIKKDGVVFNSENCGFDVNKCQGLANYGDVGKIHTNPNCPCYILDQQSGKLSSGTGKTKTDGQHNNNIPFNSCKTIQRTSYSDSGGASRFFYCPKVSRKERDGGCDSFPVKEKDTRSDIGKGSMVEKGLQPSRNNHPTVKPIDLMSYLCKLITPKGGTVLDPFMGSGSTGIAADLNGFEFIGIEKESGYYKIAEARIKHYKDKYIDLFKN